MTTTTLRPWTDLIKLYPDVESGVLTEAVFATDPGAIAAKDANVPAVNRDPEAFLRSTRFFVLPKNDELLTKRHVRDL
jgi:hypothetical protein